MRVLLTGMLTALTFHAASAQTVLKREPHYLAAGAVALVDDRRCTSGMVMKVTGRSKGGSRRKACVSLSSLTTRALPRASVAGGDTHLSNNSTIANATLSLSDVATVAAE